MHSIFGVHSTLVHYTIMLYSAQSFVYVIHNRIHKNCSSIYCLSSLHAVTAAIQGYHFICIPETHKNTCYNNLTENHTMYLKCPLTRKGQYTATLRNAPKTQRPVYWPQLHYQTNSHSFNLVRPRITVFIYYYSPLNSV